MTFDIVMGMVVMPNMGGLIVMFLPWVLLFSELDDLFLSYQAIVIYQAGVAFMLLVLSLLVLEGNTLLAISLLGWSAFALFFACVAHHLKNLYW